MVIKDHINNIVEEWNHTVLSLDLMSSPSEVKRVEERLRKIESELGFYGVSPKLAC